MVDVTAFPRRALFRARLPSSRILDLPGAVPLHGYRYHRRNELPMPKIGGIRAPAKTLIRVGNRGRDAAERVYDATRCGHDAARISRQRPGAKGVTSTMETRVGPNESIESALKRFKKMCQKSGVLAEARRHEHYEKPSVRRKKKSAAARKRRS